MNSDIKAIKPKTLAYFETNPLVLKRASQPKVSIIIPVYNQIVYTLNCLYSIKEECEQNNVEIIVINDCSTDDTLKRLNTVEGISVITNEENLGFLKNINKGIEAAKGDYVLLLNNDVIVLPNLLKEMFSVFETQTNVGAVGAMGIHPSGVLLEAGSTIYSDGGVDNIGRENSLENPKNHFLKKVDYCSGYCLLLKRFFPDNKLVQLDEFFLPAYYEETDLCMQIRHTYGLDIYYQPFAKLIHFESISYGKEVTDKKRKLVDKNKINFYKKWKTVLDKRPYQKTRLNQEYLNKNYKGEKLLVLEDAITPQLLEDIKSKNCTTHKVAIVLKNKLNIKNIEKWQRHGVEIVYPYVSKDNKSISFLNIIKFMAPGFDRVETKSIKNKFYFYLKSFNK
ncbi:MAG: glycosyltransferase family 2 protein [Bizionia paragorgiae]|uniref:glycosyltransferase family 2 protein n=1 Tax=Bizionia paragorgiae TaxID=283786 RepID=UPI003C596B4F